jgi:hypothetical protein
VLDRDQLTWSAPVVSGGRLFIRNENARVALDLTGTKQENGAGAAAPAPAHTLPQSPRTSGTLVRGGEALRAHRPRRPTTDGDGVLAG